MHNPIKIDPQTSIFLDSIRGLSAIIVLFSHIIQIYVLPYLGTVTPLDDISNFLASYAVMAFFIISGFVIATSILANIQKNEGRFDLREFLIGRLTRILPPLLFALLITYLVYLVISVFNLHGKVSFILPGDLSVIRDSASFDWRSIFGNLLFLQNIVPNVTAPVLNGALWSLSYEFWFYVLAMFFANWVVNKRIVLGGFVMMAIIVCLIYFRSFLFLTFFLTWCGGAVWAVLYHYHKENIKKIKLLALPLILGVAAIMMEQSGIGIFAMNIPYRNLYFAFIQTLICLSLVLIVMEATENLRTRQVNYLGLNKTAKFSYTLYVIHFPLLMLGFSLFHPILHTLPMIVSFLVGSLLGILIILISSVLAKWVENKNGLRRFLRLN